MNKTSREPEYMAIVFPGRSPTGIPTPELPNIKTTPKQAHIISAILSHCTLHGQERLIYLMEEWQRAGHVVAAGTTNVLLKIAVGNKLYSLAALRSGLFVTDPLIVLGWEDLRPSGVLPPKAVDRFQSAVTRIAPVHITKSTAHIYVDATFDQKRAGALLKALRDLAQTAHKPKPRPKFEWDASLPPLDITVGEKTRAGIQGTWQGCERRVQELYALLVQGWNQAGGTVHCNRPGRIYLRLTGRETEAGVLPWPMLHTFNLAVLAAPKGKRGPTVDIAWGLAHGNHAYMDYAAEDVARFEAVVSHLPGFSSQSVVRRIVIGDEFQSKHANRLLKAMLTLKSAGGA